MRRMLHALALRPATPDGAVRRGAETLALQRLYVFGLTPYPRATDWDSRPFAVGGLSRRKGMLRPADLDLRTHAADHRAVIHPSRWPAGRRPEQKDLFRKATAPVSLRVRSGPQALRACACSGCRTSRGATGATKDLAIASAKFVTLCLPRASEPSFGLGLCMRRISGCASASSMCMVSFWTTTPLVLSVQAFQRHQTPDADRIVLRGPPRHTGKPTPQGACNWQRIYKTC